MYDHRYAAWDQHLKRLSKNWMSVRKLESEVSSDKMR